MYDAIVVGARCAGAATAMLLARKGYRVLLVDKGRFPSDTLSTHYIHQPGVAKLKKWGLLERLRDTGCPPIERQSFDIGPFELSGTPPPVDGITMGYAPRRTVLDKILVDAAVEAGAELGELSPVHGLLRDEDRVIGVRGHSEGGTIVSERARIVIGADGVHSLMARLVEAPTYNEAPGYSCAFYSYWSGVELDKVELYPRPGRMVIAAPTHEGLTLAIAYWPENQFSEIRSDLPRHFMEAVDLAPRLSERLRAGSRAETFRGTRELQNFFRRPYGAGWALVGDAGYHKNPITAQGITDAFLDADALAEAVDDGLAERATMVEALAMYEWKRNERVRDIYGMTCDLARLSAWPDDMMRLLAAIRGDDEESGRFLGTIAGTVPIREYFSVQNTRRIIGTAATDPMRRAS